MKPISTLLGGGGPIVTIPASIFKTGSTSAITSTSQAATVSGGTAPYTYLWTVFNQTGNKGVTIVLNTAAATQFQISATVPGDEGSCSVTCTVTDAFGRVGVSNVGHIVLDRF
jgi:hypothetical protein